MFIKCASSRTRGASCAWTSENGSRVMMETAGMTSKTLLLLAFLALKEDSDAMHGFVIERSQHAYDCQMAPEKDYDE